MIRKWLIVCMTLALSAGCAPTVTPALVGVTPQSVKEAGATLQSPDDDAPPQQVRADLPDLGPAPELSSDVWINTEGPLRLADLRGKVVLLDMWTFG